MKNLSTISSSTNHLYKNVNTKVESLFTFGSAIFVYMETTVALPNVAMLVPPVIFTKSVPENNKVSKALLSKPSRTYLFFNKMAKIGKTEQIRKTNAP